MTTRRGKLVVALLLWPCYFVLLACGSERETRPNSASHTDSGGADTADAPAPTVSTTRSGGLDDPFDEFDDLDPLDLGDGPVAEGKPPAGENPDFTEVTVFYGTSRAQAGFSWSAWQRPALLLASALVLLLLAGRYGPRFFRARWGPLPLSLRLLAWLGLLAAISWQGHALYGTWHRVKTWGFQYSGERREPEADESRHAIDLGSVTVSVPTRRDAGTIPTESWWRGELVPDPVKHFVLRRIVRQDEGTFYGSVRSRIDQDEAKRAFVYVHGFNNSFEDAAFRTAQIAHDLSFEGAPIFYSWPSDALETAYFMDEDDAEWATGHFREFLRTLRQRTGAEVIHLVAHSMGTRVLCNALKQLPEAEEQPFDSIILAAPDIDAGIFENELAPALLPRGKLVTLYASANDAAIQLSKQFNGNPRAGEISVARAMASRTHVDTVDVSAIAQGHAYVGNNGRVLEDVRAQLVEGLPAELRSGLQRVEQPPHWVLTPPE